MTRVRRPLPRIDHRERRIPSHEDRHGAGPARRTRRSPRVGRDVDRHDYRVPSVPGIGFYPRQCVEEGGRAAVASVHDRGPLDVGVAREEVHEHGLGALGFVDEGFGAHLEAADGHGIDAVFLEEGVRHGQSHGIDVLGVARDGEAVLTETQGETAGGYAGVRFQCRLRHVGTGGVHLHGEYSHVLAVAARGTGGRRGGGGGIVPAPAEGAGGGPDDRGGDGACHGADGNGLARHLSLCRFIIWVARPAVDSCPDLLLLQYEMLLGGGRREYVVL